MSISVFSAAANAADPQTVRRVILTGSIHSGEMSLVELERVYFKGDVIHSAREIRVQLAGEIHSTDRQPATVQISSFQWQEPATMTVAGTPETSAAAQNNQIATDQAADQTGEQLPANALYQRVQLSGTISTQAVAQLAAEELEAPIAAESEAPAASGQPAAESTEKGEAAGQRLRKLLTRFEPTLATYIRYDNIKENSNFAGGASLNSTTAVVDANFLYRLQQRRWKLLSGYNLGSGKTFHDQRGDFFNHELFSDWSSTIGQKKTLGIEARYKNWQQNQAFQFVDDFNSRLATQYRTEAISGEFSFASGTRKDRRRYELAAKFDDVQVTSNTITAEDFDLQRNTLSADYFWRLQRRLTVFLDGKYQRLDYDNRTDSNQYQLSPGVEFWLASRITGRLQIGRHAKDYAGNIGGDFDETIWEANLSWRPRRNTTVLFNSARQVLELFSKNGAVQAGQFAVQTYAGITVTRTWSPLWDSRLEIGKQHRQFINDDQDEDTLQFLLSTNFHVTPRFTLAGEGAYTTQDSTAGLDFDRWTVTVRANMKL